MTTTPGDLLDLAFHDAGIVGDGQSADNNQINSAFIRLTQMMAQWNLKRWLVYHLVDLNIVSTGAQTYTIGPGGDINVVQRPDNISAAFVRQINTTSTNKVDYPLAVIFSREDYDRIALKTLGTWPQYVYLDADFPLGNLKFWPVPQSAIYQLFITVKAILQQFTSVAQTIVLPPEYFAAIEYSMARRLRASYRMPADPELNALAKDALNVIRKANAQVPRLSMPDGLVRPALYNILSDQSR